MLHGYDIMHLHTNEEIEKINSVNSIVIFFKVLGFSDLVIKDYKKATLISHALSKISEQFNNVNQVSINDHTLKTLKNSCEFEDNNYSTDHMYSTIFSNSVILSCPVMEKNRLFTVKEIIKMICDVQFHMLQEGFLIRGGITIGDICHNNKYVFGKAVIEVFELERKKAMYPRIIISDKLLNAIVTDLNKSILVNTDNYKYLLENEYFYDQYIQEDDDLVTYIDYLGVGLLKFAEIMGHNYIDDFKTDFLDKIDRVIKDGKNNKNIDVKKKYFWLETKFFNKLKLFNDI